MLAHIDVDSFFAAVIVRKNPCLKGKPLLALGMGGGCVIAASYEAKNRGVKTGMHVKEALACVPDAIRMPADFHEAALGSQEIEALLGKMCPVIEKTSIDEWFLDLEGLVGGIPVDISAWTQSIQKNILEKTALMVSIGVASTKTLAKMASEYIKPGGITLIQESNIPHTSYYILLQDFLNNRPAAAIPGVGPRRKIHTDARGWKTAWDVAQAPAEELRRLFGKNGVELKEELLGKVIYSVTGEYAAPKSVSRCRSFHRTADRDFIWAHLLKHLEYAVLKMRRDDLMCRGVSVWLREDAAHAYAHSEASASLPQPLHAVEALLPFSKSCFERTWSADRSYTQTGLALWRLVPARAQQYSLFRALEETERDERMQETIDGLHSRFGRSAVTRCSALGVKTGTTVTVDLPMYQ